MTDIDTIARGHVADTRSWLLEIEPPPLSTDSAIAVIAVDPRHDLSKAVRRRWSSAWAFAAGFAAVIAAGVVMVALSLGNGANDLAGDGLRPVELGLGYVWPDQPGSSSPEALGAAFAVEVLGWDEATVSSDPGYDPLGPAWVQVSQPGREPIEMLTAPHSGPGRVLHQIGEPSSVGAVIPGEPKGTRVALAQHPGATHAEITVRVKGSETEIVFTADADDLAAGYVETSEIPSAIDVVTVMVRYLDNNGEVVTATGGDFYSAEPSEDPPAGGGERESPPTTVPIAEAEREAMEYVMRLAILDGVAIVDGSGVDTQFRDAVRSALEARCSTRPADLPSDFVDGTVPAYETANQILSSLNCEVSTMAVTIAHDGSASGVIAVLDPDVVDDMQQAVVEGIEVEVDVADF